jgi:hypothetical protein
VKNKNKEDNHMDWFKKHVDAVLVVSAIVSSVIWMNGRFNQVDKQFASVDKQFALVDKEFSKVHEELSVLKTVLIRRIITWIGSKNT